jgi:DNA modification methylase
MAKSGHILPAMASRVELWPLGKLVPYDRNSRTHSEEQIDQIASSILRFGFTAPILVDEKNGDILAGHARLRAARKLHLDEVPVIPLGHLSEAEKRAYIIADNKLAENAGWDEKMLRAELQDLLNEDFDLSVTGFSEDELKALLDESGDPLEGETDAEEAPPVAEEAVSRPGDLWLLGNHRLAVGDCLDPPLIDALLEGEKAQLVLTDPPYNVDYHNSGGRSRKTKISRYRDELHDVIEQDDASPEQFQEFIDAVMKLYAGCLKPDGSLYTFMPLMRHTAFECALEDAGFVLRCHIIWAKNHIVLTYSRYKQQHETILYCHLKGQSDAWYGDKTQSTVWQEKKPQANREHPTMKPVELLERAIMNSTRRGDLVFDFFGGSGSTMIACERLGRKCRMVELSPVYCDVILRRWSAYTRRQPILAAGGSTFLQIERERLILEKAAGSERPAASENVPSVSDAEPVGVRVLD